MTIKKKTFIITVAFIITMLGSLTIQFRLLQNINTVWSEYQTKAVASQQLLAEVKSQFGYGGFIHNFKNYVLRGQDKYVEKFKKNETFLFKALEDLERIVDSPEEKEATENIRTVATKYKNAIDTAVRLVAEGKTISEIDKTIKINDTPAFEAFKIITEKSTALEINKKDEMQKILKRLSIFLVLLVLTTIVFFIGFIMILTNLTKRLSNLKYFAGQVGAGNLVAVANIEGNDELTSIAKDFNTMGLNLRKMFEEISNTSVELNASSAKLLKVSGQMAESSENTVEKSNSVAAASEEMNVNVESIAAAMEEASINVKSMASSSAEMSQNLNKVTDNTNQARNISIEAVNKTEQASTQVNELGEIAEEIGMVTDTIKAISNKTNLLALNATIEAARAGEAGKGFAVVANEIKDLAQQTAEATDDIAKNLQGVQQSTSNTVAEIGEVTDVISKVAEIVTSISEAVKQQNDNTSEISENVVQASKGLDEISENVNQTSDAVGQVTMEISEVNEGANEISNSSTMIRTSASELSELAEKLKGMVDKFQIH